MTLAENHTASCIEQEETVRGNLQHANKAKTYLQKVASEFSIICKDLLEILDVHLIPSTMNGESKIFYVKLKEEYLQHLSEIAPVARRQAAADHSLEAYTAAQDMSLADLPAAHPVRLSRALSLAMRYHDVLRCPDRARRLAEEAFRGAVEGLDSLDEGSYRESALLLRLLEDNLAAWASERAEAGGR